MSKAQEQSYSFSLSRMDILEKKLAAPTSPAKIKFAFDMGLQVAHNVPENDCIYQMRVSVKNKSDSQELALIVLRCVFNIPNYLEISRASDSENPLPHDLMYLLNTVVIGTMRGVMFAEFRGTALHDAYLPVLDPRRFELAT